MRLQCSFNCLTATYEGYTSCNYENQTICVSAGSIVSAPNYWEWACIVSPFLVTPLVPDAPSTYLGTLMCAGISNKAAPWGSGTKEFIWRGALVWPCGYLPSPPGTNTGSPCGVTNFVGGGFCGPDNPMPPVHNWYTNPSTGDVHLDLY